MDRTYGFGRHLACGRKRYQSARRELDTVRFAVGRDYKLRFTAFKARCALSSVATYI